MITEFNTLPKKIYYVQTAEACTVLDADGEPLAEITAPGGYFPGIGSADAATGTVTFSPAVKRVIGPFDLAPQLQLTLLGLLGGDQFPAGYTRLAYLESTGTQYIDTMLDLTNNHSVELTSQMTRADVPSCALFGGQEEGNQQSYAVSLYQKPNDSITYLLWFFYKTTSVGLTYNNISGINVYDKLQISIAGGELRINGRFVTTGAPGEFSAGKTCWIFDRNSYSDPVGFYGKMFNFKVSRGEPVLILLPALDPTGTPCMYDTVTKMPFHNAGTGAFIAGLETQQQLEALLRKLPDRNGQDVGTLQVRLADDLQTPENLAKLDSMVDKNWEISQAA